MAQGKPLGTVFVELDLDATKFSAAQKRIIKDAGVVTKEVEKNYSTLGIKSSAMYDAMRLQAENAYQGILHSSRSTANDLVRAEQAKAAKITAINEQQFGKQVSMMGQLKSNWLGIAAAIASLSSVFAIGKSVLQLGDDIAKASEKLGIGAEKLSAMKYAAELSDVSFEALQKGMKKFSQAITEAEGKGTDAATAFSAMGIATKDAHGKTLPLDTLFGKVADRFAAMEDGAGKVSLAVALFGRAGMDMIPVLNKGAAGMAAMEAEAGRLGATISGKTAKQLEEANDNLKSMWMTVKGVTASITGGLLGAVKRMGDTFGESLGNMEGGFGFSSAAKTFKAPTAPGKIAAPNLDEKTDEFLAKQAKESQAEFIKMTKDFGDGLQDVNEENRLKSQAELELWAEGYKVRTDEILSLMGDFATSAKDPLEVLFETGKAQQALEDWNNSYKQGMSEMSSLMSDFGDDTRNGFETAMTAQQMFEAAFATGNVQAAIQQINDGLGATWASLAESQSYIDLYKTAWMDANLAISESITSLYSGMQNWISSSIQGLVMGTATMGDVLRNLGSVLLQVVTDYVAKWIVAQVTMATMEKTIATTSMAIDKVMTAAFVGSRIAQATASTGAGAARALSEYSWPYSAVVAAAVLAKGAVIIAGMTAASVVAGATHGGLDYVPAETTYLLDKGERVVSPKQNKDLTDFLGGGGGGQGQTIVLQLDGDVLARWVNRNSKRTGMLQLAPA